MPKITLKIDENTSKTLEVENEKILFDAFEELGVELRHGCLSGSCGTCKINVLEGTSSGLKEPSAIEADTLESILGTVKQELGIKKADALHLRLACRAKVLGDLTFEPFELKKVKKTK